MFNLRALVVTLAVVATGILGQRKFLHFLQADL